MIDWLLNDFLWGWGRKRAYVLTVVFLGTGLGYCNASTTLMEVLCMWDLLKKGGPTEYATIFKRVLDIIRIKTRHFKGKAMKKFQSSRARFKRIEILRAQSNELIVPGHTIAFS